MVDHDGIYLNKDDNLESVFLLGEEPTEGTLFSIEFYEELGDIYDL